MRFAAYTAAFRQKAFIPEADVPSVAVSLPALDGALNDVSTLHALGAIARTVSPSTVFEIGTYRGAGTRVLASNSNATVYTLDLPVGEGAEASASDTGLINSRAPHELLPNCHQLYGNSLDFDFAPYTRAIDLVYVDGGHSHPVVDSDTRNAITMVRPGGAVVWDDYGWHCPDVVETLDELARSMNLVRMSGTNLVLLRT